MKSICVFCGSSTGFHRGYQKAAEELGRKLAEEDIRLIYGGGSIGLMGVLAETVLGHGGKVTGVIPKFLYDMEVGLDMVTELIIVDSMHERKQKMAELAHGFVALPGGIGTMEELFEVFTWSQLKLIRKPVAILNVNNYFDNILAQLGHMASEGFIKPQMVDTLIKSSNIHELIMEMRTYRYSDDLNKIDKT